MEQMFEKLQEINGYLLENAKGENGLGLLHGKLGLGIYFYHLAKKTESPEFQAAAESLIGEIFEKLRETKLSPDFENGLAGIAWGISYLVNSDFVEADLDETLSELDDRIFKFLEDQKNNLLANFRSGTIGYLFYCFDRLESSLRSGHQSNTYIFQKLGAGLLNQLGQLIEEEKIQDREPQLFNVFWDLPLVLILLGQAKQLQVNPTKAERILDYLLPSLLSLFPRFHSNRLYLLLGIESVLKEIDRPGLRKYAVFIKETINLESIYTDELKSLDIRIQDGVSGVGLISKKLAILTGDNSFMLSDELVFNKINESVCWGEIDFYSPFRKSIGLVSGLSGIGWALLEVGEKPDVVKV